MEVCGEIMHGPSGTILSPDSDGDGYYDNNANCVWRIEVMEGFVIRYNFETFAVELATDCENDKVLVCCRFIFITLLSV